MNRYLTGVLAGLIATFGIGAAQAKECAGVMFLDGTTVDGHVLKLNGLGLRQATFLKVNVYVAALYVTNTSRDADAILSAKTPRVLSLRFVRDVDGSELHDAWDEGFAKNAGDLTALGDRIEAFKGMMADMKEGDKLSLIYRPESGVQVDINGSRQGTIKGDDFARALYAVWLGSSPPNAGLKTGLLGGECG